VLIEIEINGVKKYSNTKPVTTDTDFPVKWDETIYFEFENLVRLFVINQVYRQWTSAKLCKSYLDSTTRVG
jgi:hypothetical protein